MSMERLKSMSPKESRYAGLPSVGRRGFVPKGLMAAIQAANTHGWKTGIPS